MPWSRLENRHGLPSQLPQPQRRECEIPHQVALPDDLCVHRNLTLISAFLEEHGLDCVTTSVQAIWPCGKYEQMRLHCFADAESAAAFQRRFGGEMFDPKRDREGGRVRGSWRRKGEYQRVLDLGDLHVPQLLRN